MRLSKKEKEGEIQMSRKASSSDVEAYILVKLEAGKEKIAVSKLTSKMITEVNLIYGAYDLIVKVVSPLPEKLDEFIFSELRRIDGVKETATCIVAERVK
jgi:DNA-binding Lrp family transcriptional regulator